MRNPGNQEKSGVERLKAMVKAGGRRADERMNYEVKTRVAGSR
jgi:hypothetical protein